jgi:hypothetical protein
MVYYHRVNDSKFCPRFKKFYSQDCLSFDFLSRDWILKLDPNDNFRTLELDHKRIHKITKGRESDRCD